MKYPFSSLKSSFIINFIGNFWVALVNIAFVPFYLKYIGSEGYGLVGIFTSLQVVLSLLDAGLSMTLNRELARLSTVVDSQQQMRSTVRTLEIVYCGVSLLIGLIAISISPLLAQYWVNPKVLSRDVVQSAFILLSISLVFQFPIGFYSGGLLGLQKQVELSGLKIFFSTLRSGGALVVLAFFSSSVLTFFSWTLLITCIWSIVLWRVVWHSLPKTINQEVIRFDKAILLKVKGFAAGMSGIAIAAALLTQTDKFILGKMLPLSELGLYTFAQTYGMAICSLIVPTFYQILFPKFTQMIESRDENLYPFYLDKCQKLSKLLFPLIISVFFVSDIVFNFLYKTADNKEIGIQIFSIFLLSALVNSTLHLPYNLFIAYGKSKYIFYLYLKIFVVFVFLLYFGTFYWGILGGAIANFLLQIVYLILLIRLVNKHLNFPNLLNWYKQVVFVPLLNFLLIFFFCNFFTSSLNPLIRVLTHLFVLVFIYGFYEYRYQYIGVQQFIKQFSKNA